MNGVTGREDMQDKDLIAVCGQLVLQRTMAPSEIKRDWIGEIEILTNDTEYLVEGVKRAGAGATVLSEPFDVWLDVEAQYDRDAGRITGYIAVKVDEQSLIRQEFEYDIQRERWHARGDPTFGYS